MLPGRMQCNAMQHDGCLILSTKQRLVTSSQPDLSLITAYVVAFNVAQLQSLHTRHASLTKSRGIIGGNRVIIKLTRRL